MWVCGAKHVTRRGLRILTHQATPRRVTPMADEERLPLPTGLRAIVTRYGNDRIDAVENCIVLEPQPPPLFAELKPWDVVIAVRSSAVGWVDTIMASGQYQHQAKVPYSPGLEYAGNIVWMGPEAESRGERRGLLPGTRVYTDGLIAGPRTNGPYQRWGGLASYAVAPVGAVHPIPEGWSFDQACSFHGSYETAYHCLVTCGGLKAGETVLIHGASGAVGVPAIHIARLLGATVIATGRSEGKLRQLNALGAHHTLHLKHDGDGLLIPFRSKVKALTGGRGVDVVYDTVGGAISEESLRCVTFGARFLICGWASTPDVAPGRGKRGAPQANRLPTNLMMMKGLRVIGCPAIISVQQQRKKVALSLTNGESSNPWDVPTFARGEEISMLRRKRLTDLFDWIHSGSIPPPLVSGARPLVDVKLALTERAKGAALGGTVVHLPVLGHALPSNMGSTAIARL